MEHMDHLLDVIYLKQVALISKLAVDSVVGHLGSLKCQGHKLAICGSKWKVFAKRKKHTKFECCIPCNSSNLGSQVQGQVANKPLTIWMGLIQGTYKLIVTGSDQFLYWKVICSTGSQGKQISAHTKNVII